MMRLGRQGKILHKKVLYDGKLYVKDELCIWKYSIMEKKNENLQNEQHPGFARGHPPYYWPGSKEFNFRDQTRAGAVSLI